MQFELNLDPKKINEYVSKQVLDSVVGVEIKGIIEEAVKNLGNPYNNAYEKIVRRMIEQAILKLISVEYKTLIENQVKDYVTPELVSKLTEKAWKTLNDSYS